MNGFLGELSIKLISDDATELVLFSDNQDQVFRLNLIDQSNKVTAIKEKTNFD
jgi:hypothetical protein